MPRDEAGEPVLADDLAISPEAALAMAQRMLDEGRPFHAHEVLEAVWKQTADPAERDLWQGLAQLAVGLTHALRGNATGAAALLRRGASRLAGYPAPGPHGIDVAGLTNAATALAERIELNGLSRLHTAETTLRLTVAHS